MARHEIVLKFQLHHKRYFDRLSTEYFDWEIVICQSNENAFFVNNTGFDE